MPDVFDMLSDDHRMVERLFQQYAQSREPDVALQICDELTVHALVEEELVYPLLASKVGTGLAEEARHEHRQAKDLVVQIEAGVAAGDDVDSFVEQLRQGVAHHVQEEEGEIFPAMREKLPTMVAEMGDDVKARKAQLKEQLAEARGNGQSSTVVATKGGKRVS